MGLLIDFGIIIRSMLLEMRKMKMKKLWMKKRKNINKVDNYLMDVYRERNACRWRMNLQKYLAMIALLIRSCLPDSKCLDSTRFWSAVRPARANPNCLIRFFRFRIYS